MTTRKCWGSALLMAPLLFIVGLIPSWPAENVSANKAVQQGNAFLRSGNLDSAISVYAEAIRIDARAMEAYLGRGKAYL